MAFQVKRTGAAEYGRWIKVLIAGDPGAGKTRFGRSWPHPFYISAEGRMMSVAADALPYVDVDSTNTLKDVLLALRQPPEIRAQQFGVPIETVIVDTADEIQRICVRERLKTEKKDAMSQGDWGWLGDKLRAILRAFRNLDMHVVITSHIKDYKDDDDRIFVKPQISGAVGDEISAYVDLALLARAEPLTRIVDGDTVRDIRRFLQTYKDRQHTWIKDHSGRLPQEFEVDFETDFQRLFDTIYGGIVLPETTSVTVGATPPAAQPESQKEPEAPVSEAADEPATKLSPETVAAVARLADTFGEVDVMTPEEAEAAVQYAQRADDAPVAEAPPAKREKPVKEVPADADPQLALAGLPACSDCGGAIEDEDQVDLSMVRHKKPICKTCFDDRKKKTPKEAKAS